MQLPTQHNRARPCAELVAASMTCTEPMVGLGACHRCAWNVDSSIARLYIPAKNNLLETISVLIHTIPHPCGKFVQVHTTDTANEDCTSNPADILGPLDTRTNTRAPEMTLTRSHHISETATLVQDGGPGRSRPWHRSLYLESTNQFTLGARTHIDKSIVAVAQGTHTHEIARTR